MYGLINARSKRPPSKKVFYDPRAFGFRTKKGFVEHVIKGAQYTSNIDNVKDGMVLLAYSVTIAKQKGDMPHAWLQLIRNFLQEHAVKALFGAERGERKKNLHLQGLLLVYGYIGDDAQKELTRLIKEALLVFPNDGTQVQLRHITERDGVKYIMGYVQKDEGAGHYERISYNMSVEEMSEGKEFYNARKKTPLTTAYRLDPKNLHTEAFKWYRHYMYPIPPPNLNQTVLYMVTSGMYLPCTRWTLGGLSNSMDWPAAQQLWTMMHFPESTNANDVARTLFRQSDPGDPIYGEMNWAEVQMQVKSMRDCQLQADAQFDTQDMHDTATAQAYDESQDFWGSISASSGNVRAPGAMPAGCSMATAEEVAASMNPRHHAQKQRLSEQTTGIMQRYTRKKDALRAVNEAKGTGDFGRNDHFKTDEALVAFCADEAEPDGADIADGDFFLDDRNGSGDDVAVGSASITAPADPRPGKSKRKAAA